MTQGRRRGGAAMDLGRGNSKQLANGMVFSVNRKKERPAQSGFYFIGFLIAIQKLVCQCRLIIGLVK